MSKEKIEELETKITKLEQDIANIISTVDSIKKHLRNIQPAIRAARMRIPIGGKGY